MDPVVCVLTKRGRLVVAEPLFGPGERISLPGKAQGDARIGDMVLVGGGKRGARVFRRIGRPDVARDVLEALMLDQGLYRAFPRRVEEGATGGAEAPPPGPAARPDPRRPPPVPIDPHHAQGLPPANS